MNIQEKNVSAISGTDGKILWSVARSTNGVGTVVGDINGNNTPDVAIATNNPSALIALSGSDGSLIWGTNIACGANKLVRLGAFDQVVALCHTGSATTLTAVSASAGKTAWSFTTTVTAQVGGIQAVIDLQNLGTRGDKAYVFALYDAGDHYEVNVFDSSGSRVWSLTSSKTNLVPFDQVTRDYDGDGINDILMAIQDMNLRLIDGYTGNYLGTVVIVGNGLAQNVVQSQDVNGDRIPDMIIQDSYGTSMVSGSTGALIWSRPSTQFLGSLQDIDNDGIQEVLLLTKQGVKCGDNNCLSVRIIATSGTTGKDIWNFTYLYPVLSNPPQLLLPLIFGDLNGDGVNDIMTPIGHFAPPAETFTVTIINGKDGKPLKDLYTSPSILPDAFTVGMLNGLKKDGLPEISVGYRQDAYNTRTSVISGRTGQVIQTWTTGSQIPFQLTPLGDLNNDGIPEVLIRDYAGTIGVLDGATLNYIWKVDASGYTIPNSNSSIIQIAKGEVRSFRATDGIILWEFPTNDSLVGLTRDVDHDGRLDLLLASTQSGSSSLSLLASNGSKRIWSIPITRGNVSGLGLDGGNPIISIGTGYYTLDESQGKLNPLFDAFGLGASSARVVNDNGDILFSFGKYTILLNSYSAQQVLNIAGTAYTLGISSTWPVGMVSYNPRGSLSFVIPSSTGGTFMVSVSLPSSLVLQVPSVRANGTQLDSNVSGTVGQRVITFRISHTPVTVVIAGVVPLPGFTSLTSTSTSSSTTTSTTTGSPSVTSISTSTPVQTTTQVSTVQTTTSVNFSAATYQLVSAAAIIVIASVAYALLRRRS